LLGVLDVAPAGAMRGDVGITALVEGHRLGSKGIRCTLGASFFDGVQTCQQLLPALTGRCTGGRKRHSVERT
jgi:hypothetical protein